MLIQTVYKSIIKNLMLSCNTVFLKYFPFFHSGGLEELREGKAPKH